MDTDKMECEAETNEDSDSSLDDEDNELQEQELTNKVTESPYEYENHVKLIKFLKESGELEKLRDARNAMAQIFPLTEELWLEWVQDEIKLASTEHEKKAVLELLDRAVSDYLSVSLWLEYCQFTIGGIGTEAGLAKARDTYERAVSVAGLHVTRGSLIWDSYRVFENAILQSLQPQIGAVQTSEEQTKLEEQEKRIESLFKRQLSTPLLTMEETYLEFQEFLTDGVPKEITDDYNKALCQLKAYHKYEIALNKAEAPRLAEYENYIRALQSKGDIKRLQCIYERALVENCLNASLWQAYTKAMDEDYRVNHAKELKDDENVFYRYHQPLGGKEEMMTDVESLQKPERDVVNKEKNQNDCQSLLNIHKRAVRNCPWSAELWIGYMRAMERLKQPHTDILGVCEEAILAGFSGSNEYLDFWTAWLNYLKRRIEWKSTATVALQEFRDTVQRAIDFMNQYFGGQGDSLYTLQKYWAKVEMHYNNNLDFGREQWNTILTETENGYKAQYWLEYYQLELKYGDLDTCREVLLQAVDMETDTPQQICETLLNFEREYGSLNSFEESNSKVQVILEAEEKHKLKAAKRAEKKMAKSGGGKFWKNKNKEDDERIGQTDYKRRGKEDYKHKERSGDKRDQSKWKKPDNRGEGRKEFHNKDIEKRKKQEKKKQPEKKNGKAEETKREPMKRKADTESEVSAKHAKVDDDGFIVPTFPVSASLKSPSKAAQKPQVASQETEEAISGNKDSEMEEVVQKDTISYRDDLTVFVKNLSYNISEEKIRNAFDMCGEITEIRMKVENKSKFRGYCYVEFKDKESVEKALKRDRYEIDGRPIYVDPSVDKSKGDQKTTKQFKYDTSLDKKKLFVSGLPRSTTKEDLEEMFSKYGVVKDVRVVTYRSGVPKGLAFIEYEKESEASSAVLGADGTVIGEHTVSVAISNPPTRKPQAGTAKESAAPPVSLGAKGISGPRGKSRTQIALVPRAVKRPQPNNPKPIDKSETIETDATEKANALAKPKLTNADFAKMLLKK
ncbi:squamous cell carcinoma antigen recognized by T-cells 3-like [Antedon mediterranea]|uniref:squamous cell carcinoma antigen recognized by T-cells 3-like n=1 Tax=Antedon mediterranea TaxID=105859 RepID=UPI003AF8854D